MASVGEEGGGGEESAAFQLAAVPFAGNTRGSTTAFSTSRETTSSSTVSAASVKSSQKPPSSGVSASVFLSQQLPYAHLLDTLPYVDALSPEQHEAAKQLVQEEMAAIRKECGSGGRRRQQQLLQSNGSSTSSRSHVDPPQLLDTGEAEEDSASATAVAAGKDTSASSATAGRAVGATARDKQHQIAGDNHVKADEEWLHQRYLETFPLPATPHLDDANTLAGRELARLARGESMQKLDLSRYETFPSPPAAGNKAQESEWRRTVDGCEGLLEHLSVGQTNLELMNLHAVSLWMRHLQDLSLGEQHWSAAAKRLRGDVDRVSKQRKIDQVECSSSLRDLVKMREDYEHRNEEILSALGKLQQEVVELKLRCYDRGVLPDDYEHDSDFEEGLEAWEALLSPPPPAAPVAAIAASDRSSGDPSSSSTSKPGAIDCSPGGDNSRSSSSSGSSRSKGSRYASSLSQISGTVSMSSSKSHIGEKAAAQTMTNGKTASGRIEASE